MARIAANSKTTAKPKAKPRGKPFPKGVSGNPAGRPKDGESWASVLKDLANKTSEELAGMYGDNELGRAFKKYPKGVQMKYLVGGRVLAALMHEPTSGLFNAYMDRMEGKVPDRLQHEGKFEVKNLAEILARVYGNIDG